MPSGASKENWINALWRSGSAQCRLLLIFARVRPDDRLCPAARDAFFLHADSEMSVRQLFFNSRPARSISFRSMERTVSYAATAPSTAETIDERSRRGSFFARRTTSFLRSEAQRTA